MSVETWIYLSGWLATVLVFVWRSNWSEFGDRVGDAFSGVLVGVFWPFLLPLVVLVFLVGVIKRGFQ